LTLGGILGFGAEAALYTVPGYRYNALPPLTAPPFGINPIGPGSVGQGYVGVAPVRGPQVDSDQIRRDVRCNTDGVDACVTEAHWDYALCQTACNPWCSADERYPNPPHSRACSDCRSRTGDCGYIHSVAVATCLQAGCPPGLVCMQDVARPTDEYCCDLGSQSCDGVCFTACEPPKRRNRLTCGCDCQGLPPCGPPRVLDWSTCYCVCPSPCSEGFLQDARTCDCHCPEGQTPCDNKCVRLDSDIRNCGSCGHLCSDPKICVGGQCVCPTGRETCAGGMGGCCRAGEACCNGACKNLATDTNNCGRCFKACFYPQVCVGGQCVCPTGHEPCAGGIDYLCCDQGEKCCNDICKKVATDPANCGTCGRQCSSAKLCVGGQCVCPFDREPCLSGCCAVGEHCCTSPDGHYQDCVNFYTTSSPKHCGACNHACDTAGGQYCHAGQCICEAGRPPCGNICCPAGSSCVNGVCALPCNSTQQSGTDRSDRRNINLGAPAGAFTFSWNTYTVPDQVRVLYEGQDLLQAGCTGNGPYGQSQTIHYSGSSSFVTVEVLANCAGTMSSTDWTYTLGCAWDPFH